VCSSSAPGAFVPAVGCPGSSDQATDGDDRVGEVEEGIDDGGAAFVAAGEAVEGVLPGVCAFDVPAPAGLDRCFLALARDAAVEASLVEEGAGGVRVVAGVQVHGDVVR
jgi:hypothetical protein